MGCRTSVGALAWEMGVGGRNGVAVRPGPRYWGGGVGGRSSPWCFLGFPVEPWIPEANLALQKMLNLSCLEIHVCVQETMNSGGTSVDGSSLCVNKHYGFTGEQVSV